MTHNQPGGFPRPEADRPRPALVSVIMPAFNAERYVGRAIDSALAQTFTDWELIVVDDGSTDRTGEIVRGIRDQRITCTRRENGGEAASRNVALDAAAGEFIAFLDADDVFLDDHLETTVAFLQRHPEHVGVYTDGYYIAADERRLQTLSSRRRGPLSGRVFDEVLRGADLIAPPVCVVLRRDPVEDHRLRFDEGIGLGTDWDFFTQVADLGSFGYVDRITCLYRLHGANMTVQTPPASRRQGLAACRTRAIHMPSFRQCPAEIRATVFYDLLLNGLVGSPERQQDVVEWPQFRELPASEQARLLRLIASRTIIDGGDRAAARRWLARSLSLNPVDVRARGLYGLATASPRLCRIVLRIRTLGQRRLGDQAPYADLRR